MPSSIPIFPRPGQYGKDSGGVQPQKQKRGDFSQVITHLISQCRLVITGRSQQQGCSWQDCCTIFRLF